MKRKKCPENIENIEKDANGSKRSKNNTSLVSSNDEYPANIFHPPVSKEDKKSIMLKIRTSLKRIRDKNILPSTILPNGHQAIVVANTYFQEDYRKRIPLKK